MKKTILFILISIVIKTNAQETLQTVSDRGNSTTNSLQIGGQSVNANTTKLFINNPLGKNWALSAGSNMISEQGFNIYNWTDNPNTPLFSITNEGKVGIGVVGPQANLDIYRSYDAANNKTFKMFYQGSWGHAYYATDFRFLDIASTEGGKILQLNGYGMGIGVDPPSYSSQDKLYVNGNVGIGTIVPKEKLSVNGNIRAKEVKVETANWPDYVFEKNYKLTSLTDLESYLKTNKHLPGIPDAKTIEKDGIAISETIKAQQKIIEELTLHLIEKEKTLNDVLKRLEKIENQTKK